jgi:hypothetical protein
MKSKKPPIDSVPHAKSRTSKEEAINRLISAGHRAAAERLRQWRDRNGNNWGWDGYIRRAEPTLVPAIWP